MKVTLEDVIKKFDSKIETTILNKRFKFEEVEDVKQDIYLTMLKRKYLQKYNSKYALSTYIYTFVNNHCNHVWRDSLCKKRVARYGGISMDSDPYLAPFKTSTGSTESLFLKDILSSRVRFTDTIETDDFISNILQEVSKNKAYMTNTRKGRVNLKKVIDLVVSGYNVREAIKKLRLNCPSVFRQFKRLSSKRWVSAYIKN